MTVRQLLDILGDFDQDLEVRIANQPSWPFEYSIDVVKQVDFEDEDVYDEEGDGNVESIVYIGEGSQLGYLPGHAKEELGW